MTLIGATTENPYFEVNSALLSRCQVVDAGAARARRSCSRSSAAARPRSAPRCPTTWRRRSPRRAGGDARTALSTLELAWETAQAEGVAARGAARRGRGAQAAAPLRQGRRPALRLRLGLHQVDARLRSRRRGLLPRRDARGRRGSALHRAAHGRSSPRRTSATPIRGRCWSRSPPRTRSSTSACPRRS